MGAGQFFSYCDPDQVQIFFRKRNWGVVISFLTIKKKRVFDYMYLSIDCWKAEL